MPFPAQVASSRDAVGNGTVSNGNGTAVVSSENGNGAVPMVERVSPTMTKDFCAPWTVPESGIADALGLMVSGDLFRYNRQDADSTVSRAECALAAYTGHKYCVAVNSGASAIFLALISAGVKQGDKVNSEITSRSSVDCGSILTLSPRLAVNALFFFDLLPANTIRVSIAPVCMLSLDPSSSYP